MICLFFANHANWVHLTAIFANRSSNKCGSFKLVKQLKIGSGVQKLLSNGYWSNSVRTPEKNEQKGEKKVLFIMQMVHKKTIIYCTCVMC